jgi:hypothetical protein
VCFEVNATLEPGVTCQLQGPLGAPFGTRMTLKGVSQFDEVSLAQF